MQVGAADPMVLAVLGPAQAGEEALGLIGARAVVAESEAVVDALGLVAGMQRVPGRSLIGIDRAAGLDAAADHRHRLFLRAHHEGQRPAATLAHHHHDPALARLVLGQPAVAALGLVVLLPDRAADIAAVDLDMARDGAVLIGGHRLAQLVRQHEGRLVLHVEIAAELQGRDTLHRVDEDGDRQQIGLHRQLAAGEDGAAGDGELVAARLALEQPANLEAVARRTIAAGADRLAARRRPAHLAEQPVRLVIAHARDLDQRKGPGAGGEEEVLGHLSYRLR